jgi:hypothetical protein
LLPHLLKSLACWTHPPSPQTMLRLEEQGALT